MVSEHGSPLGLDGRCVGHACMSVACVSLTLAFHVLVALCNVDHGCSKVVMRSLMLILWNVSSGVYDWLYDYMQLDYILVCWVAFLVI